MEYITEKEKKTVKLTENAKSQIAKSIYDNFTSYNDSRRSNLEIANRLIKEIFFKYDLSSIKDENEKWKSKMKMCKIYMFFSTLKSFIWKYTYSGINSMFDVSGESLEADNDSNKQKAALVDVMEKMEFSKISDEVIDFSLIYGELISFSTWKKKTELYRRPINFFETLFSTDIKKLPLILEAKAKGKKYYVDERIIYDNPIIIPVNPANFVFDVAQASDFDSCQKIYKTWKTPDDIINNRYYTVNAEISKELRDLVTNQPDSVNLSNQTSEKLKDEMTNGSTIEVLEHWGDFTMQDGSVLKNWHIVVVARKYVVCFHKNPFLNNPFTYGAYLVDPTTKRGLSPLASILDLSSLQETLMNKTIDLQSLIENPPIFAPEGFFEETQIKLFPGKVINFDPTMYNTSLLKPMQFNAGVFINDITFLSDLMSEISGIFPNMAGADEAHSKTATEISVKSQGQSTRLSMILDTINQNYIIPSVKKLAKLKANFMFGIEQIFLNKDNNPENVIITDKIRQAEYRYTYRDRNSINERINFADMTIAAIERFAQFMPLNIPQVFKWYMEQKGVEAPERFIASQNPANPDSGSNYIQNSPFETQDPSAPVPTGTDGFIPQTPVTNAA